MGDLSKWEAKAAKINIVVPIVALAVIIALAGVMTILKPKPPDVKKKSAKDQAAMVEEDDEESIDWENF
jgi:uncharacterized protein (UPF0254 family)